MKTTIKTFCCLLTAACMAVGLAGCTPRPTGNVAQEQRQPTIYPDYADVTIPVNIAPLNFLVREPGCDAVQVTVGIADNPSLASISVHARGNEVCFSLHDWRETLRQAAGSDLVVTLTARIDGSWKQFKPFRWHVVSDSIDPYLTYRLIEPDYEIFNNLTLQERCLENFDERSICNYGLVGNRCMNCHAYAGQNPNLSMLYVRGEGGGAILNREGQLHKLNLKTDSMASSSVYYGFSPNGRYLVFSTNNIIPAFHSLARKRLEVFDAVSDVYVADLQENRIFTTPLLADSMAFETFPSFSPDGKRIYFCAAPHVSLPNELKKLQYSLVSIPFDQQTGTIGNHIDTLVNAQRPIAEKQVSSSKSSVCHPRVSPDGQYILYTVADYGTFPIWHPEADQQLINLQTGQKVPMQKVNSPRSDTYHSWSSNSRWFVFASKRDDGLYGKPYFCYIDRQGRAHKPFCLPQKDPVFYDHCLKSFNAPELGIGPLPFTAADVADAMQRDAEKFK